MNALSATKAHKVICDKSCIQPACDMLDNIANELNYNGFCVVVNALCKKVVSKLQEITYKRECWMWQHAGIGRHGRRSVNKAIRSDLVCWIDGADGAEESYLTYMDNLRLGINESLFLGLFTYESHYSKYPIGSFYEKHLDIHSDCTSRAFRRLFI